MYDLESMDKRLLVFGSLFLIANRMQSKMDARMEGLTAKQWFVILMLEMCDEPPTLKQLAEMCNSSHQNTKQLVLKLQDKRFVDIMSDKKDARAMRIVLTEKVTEWDAANRETATAFIGKMYAGLPDEEVAGLSASLLKIFDNLDTI